MAYPYALSTFEESFYLANNPDVVTAIANGDFSSALQHYEMYGENEGRLPNSAFDPQFYFSTYPDVLSAVNAGTIPGALWHYENYGLSEGRRPSEQVDFNEANYLAQNPDVAAAVAAGDFVSGWQHYVLYGQDEGREPGGTTPPIGETIQLTVLPDNISLDGTQVDTVQGLVAVDGVQTFSAGDIIDGNGNTILRLVVADEGAWPHQAAFATVKDIAQVDLVAGTNGWVQFNAVDWHNIGSVNLTSGVDDMGAFFDHLEANGTDWTIDGVAGSLSASFTNDSYFYMSADHNGSISWVDGVVNGSAGAGEDVYFSSENWGNNQDVAFGDVTLVGTSGDSGTFELSASADMGGDVTVGNVSITGFIDWAGFAVYNGWHTGASDPVNTTVGDISVDMAKSGDIWVSVEQWGENQVGDVTVGNVDLMVGVNADAWLYVENYGDYDNIGDAVTVGNMTVGDVVVDVAQFGSFEASFDHTADAWWAGSSATVGNMQIGALHATLGQSADGWFDIDHSAWAGSATGDATLGTLTVGAVALDLATSASFDVSVSVSAWANAGNATVGDIVFGDVDVSQGVNSDVSFDYEIWSGGAAAGAHAIGNVTFGELMVDANDGASFEYSVSITSDGDIGAVSFGNVAATGGVSADIWLDYSVDASNDIASVGFGDMALAAGVNADISADVSLSAWNGAIGDVTVGDVSLVAAASASATAEFWIWGNAAVGDVTFGNVDLEANGQWAWASLSATVDGGGTGGTLTFGNVDLSVNNPAKTGWAWATFSASNDVGDVVVGNIDMSTTSSRAATVDTNSVWGEVDLWADGNLTVGDISVSGGDGVVDNFASLDFAAPTWLWAGANGKVTVGAIDYSGYGAAAYIDVSTVGGAASITGTAKADTIIDNKGTNAVTGGNGADTFAFVDTNTGKTLATMDQILDFTNGAGDKIDISPVVNVGNYSEGTYADFATFSAAANAGDKAVFVGAIAGVDGVVAAVDYDTNGSVDFMINLVGVGLGGVDVDSFV